MRENSLDRHKSSASSVVGQEVLGDQKVQEDTRVRNLVHGS